MWSKDGNIGFYENDNFGRKNSEEQIMVLNFTGSLFSCFRFMKRQAQKYWLTIKIKL